MAKDSSFFSAREGQIQRYVDALSREQFGSEKLQHKAQLISHALSAILTDADAYDSLTPLTASWTGSPFTTLIHNVSVSPDSIDRMLSLTARFVREAVLRKRAWTEAEKSIVDYFLSPSFPLSADELNEAEFLRFSLPSSIVEEKFAQFEAVERKTEAAKKALNDATSELQDRIEGHKADLAKLAVEYNFVGLAAAFRDLIKSKSLEKWLNFALLIVLAIASLIVPSYFLFGSEQAVFAKVLAGSWSPAAVAKLAAALGVELLGLYFFRVVLRTYGAVRAQLTTLQLRYSLCAFIEGYVEFAKRSHKGGEASALSHFEQLVFSALPNDGGAMPRTVEGIEQVTSLVKAVRG